MRIDVVRSIARVVPHHINAPIGRHRKRAKPMPLVLVAAIIIDTDGCAKTESAVGAAREHDLGGALTIRHHTGQHVNIVVCRRPGAVHRDERLTAKSYAIDSALNKKATQINQSILVKAWRLTPDLRIRRAKASELAAKILAADKKITIGIDVQRSGVSVVWNTNRAHPREPAISRTRKFAPVATENPCSKLILEPVPRAIGLINREPFLVTSMPWSALQPRLAAIY